MKSKPTVAELEARKVALLAKMAERRDPKRFATLDGEPHLGLSAWAEDMTIAKLDAEIALARAGWVSDFPAIQKEDGSAVRAKLISTYYMGRSRLTWLVEPAQGLPRYVTDGPRALKKAGLVRAQVTKPAKVILHSAGTGLSGCTSTMVLVVEAEAES